MDIFMAVTQGDEEEVCRLLDTDPTLLEMEEGMGHRPLTLAAHINKQGVVRLLAQRGANINATGMWGKTALHWAVRYGHEAVVELLLGRGAQAGIMDEEGMTPLMEAVRRRDLRMVQVLRQHMGEEGAQMLAEVGWTPLMDVSAGGQLEEVQMLVESMGPQELNKEDEYGRTALRWAAEQGHEAVVALLLSKGAQASSRDVEGATPIMGAALGRNLSVVQTLVPHLGADWVDETDDEGRTALHWAAEGGHVGVATFLLSEGAQASRVGDDGITPVMVASMNGHLDVVQMLVPHLGAEGLEATNSDGKTALVWAAEGGHEEVATLLSEGAQLDIRSAGSWTVLMHASVMGHLGMVRLLTQHMGGEGLDEREYRGLTALHVAMGRHREEIVQALLLAGADATIMDHQGRTAQALAEEIGSEGSVRVLEWWEGELERRYLLQRAKCLHDAFTTHQDKPTAPMPAFLQGRAAAVQVLPEVEVVGRQRQQYAGAHGTPTTQASNEADSTQEKEEEGHAVLEYVVGEMNEQLFTELMQGFHAPGSGGGTVAGDDGSHASSAQDDDEEEEGEGYETAGDEEVDEVEDAEMWDDE